MNRQKYLTIRPSTTVFDNLGNSYPDIMTFPINTFAYTGIPVKVFLSEADCNRFDIFVFNYYGTSDYTDILLWLNNKASVHDLNSADEFTLPETSDLNRYYLDNI